MATQPVSGAFTSKHTTVVIKDGTGTPITATLGPGPGDLSISGLEEGNTEAIKVLDRGSFLELVIGDDLEHSGSITVWQVGDLTGHSVLDAIMKTGDFTGGITKDPGGVVWTLDMVVTMVRSAQTNVLTLSNCRLSTDWKEGKEGNSFTINFTCYKGVVAS